MRVWHAVHSKENSQTLKDFGDFASNGMKCGENGLPFERLSLAEGNVKSVLDIVFKYRHRSGYQWATGGAIVSEFKVFHLGYDFARGGNNIHPPKECVAAHWQDALMLVCDVELVEVPQIVSPSGERLNLTSNVVSYCLRRAVPRFDMSVNGAFDAGPVFPKGESTEVRSGVPVGFDQNAVCVIQRSPEIVNRVAKHGWRMAFRFRELNFPPLLECTLLMLGAESFPVFSDIPTEKPFEFVDVMIRPFYLQ